MTLMSRARPLRISSPAAALATLTLALATLSACAPAAPAPLGPSPSTEALFPPAPATADSHSPLATTTTAPVAPRPPCRSDDDCGYDPANVECGTDPRFNKQPAVIDQGLICYCDAATSACALLRVEPAPCEGESSCAVRLDPRPHPVRVNAEHPYRKPRACRAPKIAGQGERDLFTRCERTNICTMHTRECARQ